MSAVTINSSKFKLQKATKQKEKVKPVVTTKKALLASMWQRSKKRIT